MDSKESTKKPHALCVPVPYQSHISAMLQLAKLLHSKGFHITFVNTEFNHDRWLRSQGVQALDNLPSFCFRTIPDGLPASDPETNRDGALMCRAMMNYMAGPFRDLLDNLTNNEDTPPVSCIVSDGFISFATDWAAEELGIPVVLFWSISACSLMGFKHYSKMMKKGLIPLKDISNLTDGYLDTIVDGIPGMKSIKLKDLPTYLRTTDPDDARFRFGKDAPERIHRASAVVIHTFDALEPDVLNAFLSIHPRTYAVGPLQLLLNKTHKLDDRVQSIASSLWKEDTGCLQWLDSKESDSVLYVNFGSIASLTEEQLLEFAKGLANSNQPFLWIIRPKMIEGKEADFLPDIVQATKGRGLITGWCPQQEVLNHSAIGGFLTHCGWNSVLESMAAGVPMLCWPCFGDQSTNCMYICSEWEVGLEIGRDVKRTEVERLVTELMTGQSGKKLKERALHWKKLAEEATASNGSSSANLNRLLSEVLI